jgi:hypothetical protein
MSKDFLYHLSGTSPGKLRKWLDRFSGEPRIAWYPAAGEDFRDLLFLSPQFLNARTEPVSRAIPDIYLHTDYFPWTQPTFLDFLDSQRLFSDGRTSRLFSDGRTSITINHIEELPRCDLPIHPDLVHFPQGGHATGRSVFLELAVHSHKLGSFEAPVIYCFAENAAFCAKKLLPQKAVVSHIVRVRYGGGYGGGDDRGGWLENVLSRLKCECYVTDGTEARNRNNTVFMRFPELANYMERRPELITIKTLPSASWSGYGDAVSWKIVTQHNSENLRH